MLLEMQTLDPLRALLSMLLAIHSYLVAQSSRIQHEIERDVESGSENKSIPYTRNWRARESLSLLSNSYFDKTPGTLERARTTKENDRASNKPKWKETINVSSSIILFFHDLNPLFIDDFIDGLSTKKRAANLRRH